MAQLYDAFVFEDDIQMYVGLAQTHGRRVLEVACGSGRVVLPLVRAGCDVVGIDISPHMLALARAKLKEAGPTTGRANLIQADMRDLRLPDALVGDGFDVAIVAVKSFAYLLERDEQQRAVRAIAEHLRPGGVLAMDLLHPKPAWIGESVGVRRDDMLRHDPERGLTISRVESVVATDLARQVRTIRSVYELIDDRGAVVEKRFVDWPYRWTHRFEAEHLLERAGLEIEGVYGGYRQEPFTSDSRSMIFVARKAAVTRP